MFNIGGPFIGAQEVDFDGAVQNMILVDDECHPLHRAQRVRTGAPRGAEDLPDESMTESFARGTQENLSHTTDQKRVLMAGAGVDFRVICGLGQLY